MNRDFTEGSIRKSLIWFALPMMAGNLLQQLYNIVDTLIVGQFLGKEALAAVGASYTLMTFLTSILLGLCMGSGVEFSLCFGKKDMDGLKNGVFMSFILIGGVTVLVIAIVFGGIDLILRLMQVPGEIYGMMRDYLLGDFLGTAGNVPVQLFCLMASRPGQLYGSPCISRNLSRFEYLPGSVLRTGFKNGRCRGGRGNGAVTVCIRGRNLSLCHAEIP